MSLGSPTVASVRSVAVSLGSPTVASVRSVAVYLGSTMAASVVSLGCLIVRSILMEVVFFDTHKQAIGSSIATQYLATTT